MKIVPSTPSLPVNPRSVAQSSAHPQLPFDEGRVPVPTPVRANLSLELGAGSQAAASRNEAASLDEVLATGAMIQRDFHNLTAPTPALPTVIPSGNRKVSLLCNMTLFLSQLFDCPLSGLAPEQGTPLGQRRVKRAGGSDDDVPHQAPKRPADTAAGPSAKRGHADGAVVGDSLSVDVGDVQPGPSGVGAAAGTGQRIGSGVDLSTWLPRDKIFTTLHLESIAVFDDWAAGLISNPGDISETMLVTAQQVLNGLFEKLWGRVSKTQIYRLLERINVAITARSDDRLSAMLLPLPYLNKHASGASIVRNYKFNSMPKSLFEPEKDLLQRRFPSLIKNLQVIKGRLSDPDGRVSPNRVEELVKTLREFAAEATSESVRKAVEDNIHEIGECVAATRPHWPSLVHVFGQLDAPQWVDTELIEQKLLDWDQRSWSNTDAAVMRNSAFYSLPASYKAIQRSLLDDGRIRNGQLEKFARKLKRFHANLSPEGQQELRLLVGNLADCMRLRKKKNKADLLLSVFSMGGSGSGISNPRPDPPVAVVPPVASAARAVTPIAQDHWSPEDIDIQRQTYPAFHEELGAFKRDVADPTVVISQQRLDALLIRIEQLATQMQSETSRYEIFNVLVDLKKQLDTLRAGGPSFIAPAVFVLKNALYANSRPVAKTTIKLPDFMSWALADVAIKTARFADLEAKMLLLQQHFDYGFALPSREQVAKLSAELLDFSAQISGPAAKEELRNLAETIEKFFAEKSRLLLLERRLISPSEVQDAFWNDVDTQWMEQLYPDISKDIDSLRQGGLFDSEKLADISKNLAWLRFHLTGHAAHQAIYDLQKAYADYAARNGLEDASNYSFRLAAAAPPAMGSSFGGLWDFYLDGDRDPAWFSENYAWLQNRLLSELGDLVAASQSYVDTVMIPLAEAYEGLESPASKRYLAEVILQLRTVFEALPFVAELPGEVLQMDCVTSLLQTEFPAAEAAAPVQPVAGVLRQKLLTWDAFYAEHVVLWSQLLGQAGGYEPSFAPQSLLSGAQGNCVGLSLLQLGATSGAQITTLQKNLMLASALYQQKYRDHEPLSSADDSFLRKTLQAIEKAQRAGNVYLREGKSQTLDLKNPARAAEEVIAAGVAEVLVTTAKHALVVQKVGPEWQVYEPNFGRATFVTLEAALRFIDDVDRAPEFGDLYGEGTPQLRLNLPKELLTDGAASFLTRSSYFSTAERMTSLSDKAVVAGITVSRQFLYEIGATVMGNRIDAHTPLDEPAAELKLNGNILKRYLDSSVLSPEQSSDIQALLTSQGLEPGTAKVGVRDVIRATDSDSGLAAATDGAKERVKQALVALSAQIEEKLRALGLDSASGSARMTMAAMDGDPDALRVSIEGPAGKTLAFNVNVAAIRTVFKSGLTSLSEGADALKAGPIMTLVGLVQYAHTLNQQPDASSAIDHYGAVLDGKDLVEMMTARVVGMVGKRTMNVGASVSLEDFVSSRLALLARKVGGQTGAALGKLAKVLKIPVLDLVMSAWSLGDSASRLSAAVTYAERVGATMDIVFSSLLLGTSVTAVFIPGVGVLALPITYLGMVIRRSVMAVLERAQRIEDWQKLKEYLQQASRQVVRADPRTGILDFSGNHVLGNLTLDLRVSPPRLTGVPSCNGALHFGCHPEMNDFEVLQSHAYHEPWKHQLQPRYDKDEAGRAQFRVLLAQYEEKMKRRPDLLASGYSNSQWPEKVPEIPPADYRTVILGYAESMQVTTEAVMTSQGNYVEAMQELYGEGDDVDLVQYSNHRTEVQGGDHERLQIIIAVSDHMMMGSSLDIVGQYKDYEFVFTGGKGGLEVAVGGIGNYTVAGDPSVRNTVSFHQLPLDFNLQLDLTETERQSFHFHHPGGLFDGTVMTLALQNVNAIIGTRHGYDRITGNAHDNLFQLGEGGGEIHSGAGNNHFVLPGNLRGNCHIKLAQESQRNVVYFDGSSDLLEPGQCDAGHVLFRVQPHGSLAIEGYEGAALTHKQDHLTILTKDGLTMSWSGQPGELRVQQLDVAQWTAARGLSPLMPADEIFSRLQSERHLPGENCLLKYPGYTVSRMGEQMAFALEQTYRQVQLPARLHAVLTGSAGSSYVVPSQCEGLATLHLHGDAGNRELIDLSLLDGASSQVEARCAGGHCILTIKNGDKQCELVLRPPPGSPITQSQVAVDLPSASWTLEQLAMFSAHGQRVRLHPPTELSRRIDSAAMLSEAAELDQYQTHGVVRLGRVMHTFNGVEFSPQALSEDSKKSVEYVGPASQLLECEPPSERQPVYLFRVAEEYEGSEDAQTLLRLAVSGATKPGLEIERHVQPFDLVVKPGQKLIALQLLGQESLREYYRRNTDLRDEASSSLDAVLEVTGLKANGYSNYSAARRKSASQGVYHMAIFSPEKGLPDAAPMTELTVGSATILPPFSVKGYHSPTTYVFSSESGKEFDLSRKQLLNLIAHRRLNIDGEHPEFAIPGVKVERHRKEPFITTLAANRTTVFVRVAQPVRLRQ